MKIEDKLRLSEDRGKILKIEGRPLKILAYGLMGYYTKKE